MFLFILGTLFGWTLFVVSECYFYRPGKIDPFIYPAYLILNKKGYKTVSSCSSHLRYQHINIYVIFDKDIYIPHVPSTFSTCLIENYGLRISCMNTIVTTTWVLMRYNWDLFFWAIKLPQHMQQECR